MNERVANRREFLGTIGAVGAASILAGSVEAVASPALPTTRSSHRRGDAGAQDATPLRRPTGPSSTTTSRSRNSSTSSSRSIRSAGGARTPRCSSSSRRTRNTSASSMPSGVTSGTTALYTAMAALEIGPGDEVILPAWTWYADYDAIVLSGALPVFAEIDESFAIDPNDIEARITPRTKAIIACHLQGRRPTWTRSWRSRASTRSAWWKTAPNVSADATRGSTSARSATSASTASSSARPSPPARAVPSPPTIPSSSSGPCASTTSARFARRTRRA